MRSWTQHRDMHSLRLGTVAGIEVRADWSLVVLLWLLTWDFAAVALPALASGYPTAVYWIVAVLAAACVLCALFAHEMSHSVVARRHGIAVRDITLWMLGGISTIDGAPATPRDELAIAVAGPAASIALGSAALVAAVAFAAIAAPRIVIAGIVWVALVNLMLAVFNLAPAAPLDGGRILRAWLWHRSGDRYTATVRAAHAGTVFAWLLMTAGFAEFAFGGDLGGLWLIVLGWFVYGSSRAERQQAEVERGLSGLRVRDVMTPRPRTVPDTLTVADLVEELLSPSPVSAFPLTAPDGHISGLVTLTDCKRVPAAQRNHVLAGAIAAPIANVPKAAPGEPAFSALERTTVSQRRLLVFENGALVGIVTPADVLRIVQRAALRPPASGFEHRAA